MKAYITCPCTHSQNRLKLLPIIKLITEKNGINTFIFEIGGTPAEIFRRDYSQIQDSDLIIAEISEISHGVGIEIGMSYCLGLKRILLIQEGKTVTKLIQGMPDTTIISYFNEKDLQSKLENLFLKLGFKKQQTSC